MCFQIDNVETERLKSTKSRYLIIERALVYAYVRRNGAGKWHLGGSHRYATCPLKAKNKLPSNAMTARVVYDGAHELSEAQEGFYATFLRTSTQNRPYKILKVTRAVRIEDNAGHQRVQGFGHGYASVRMIVPKDDLLFVSIAYHTGKSTRFLTLSQLNLGTELFNELKSRMRPLPRVKKNPSTKSSVDNT